MSHVIQDIAGVRALVCRDLGPEIASERDATDLLGEAMYSDAAMVVIPTQRLAPDFFRLASGLAGVIVQKHVNYQRRLVIVGDISTFEAASAPFRDFVREANRGRHLWFVMDLDALLKRLT